jgi:glycosyltransferase involved in cell wall biosynthesis
MTEAQRAMPHDDIKRTKKPLMSVIIPHLNQSDALEICLESLDHQTVDHSIFEVIVVDNGSLLPPDGIIARHTVARLLRESRPGPGPARNCGVKAAVGDILCFIDADCCAHPDWLHKALNALSSSPREIILGGDVQILRDSKSSFTAIEAYERIFAYRQKEYIKRHEFSVMANLVLWRADFDKVGPLCGIEFAEDLDWGQRARAAGFTYRYMADMIVFHPARQSFGELCLKWDRHIQHSFNMARGKPWWKARWIARAFAVFCSPLASGIQVITTERVHGASARLKALAVLFSLRAYRAWRMLSLFGSTKGVSWNQRTEVI